jgi:hypothetical protein
VITVGTGINLGTNAVAQCAVTYSWSMRSMANSRLFRELSGQILASGLSLRFRVTGHSMSPTIRDGEAIVVEPVSISELTLNDIVLYRSRRGFTAHRLVGTRTKRNGTLLLLIRSDAVGNAVEPVQAEQILGKVVTLERDGRCIDLASRKAKAKQSIAFRAVRCKGWIDFLLNRQTRRLSSASKSS